MVKENFVYILKYVLDFIKLFYENIVLMENSLLIINVP